MQQARGDEVKIVSLRDPEGEKQEDTAGIEVVRLVRVGPRRYPFAWGLLREIASATLVHVHGIDGLLDQLLLSPRPFPVGVSTHGAYFHTPRHPWLKAVALRTWTARSLRRASAVWFTSEADKQTLAAANVGGEVLPNGIEFERLKAITRRPEPGVLLSVGRIDVHKGLDDLIDALPSACRARPELTLRIVGPEHSPGQMVALRRRAQALGVSDKVHLLGPLSGVALHEEIARAERAVYPSRYEGQGIAAIEAMAAHVPVITSDIEAFRAHGDHIDRISFRSPEALARTLLQPVDPARVERSVRYAQTFSWEARACAFDAAYAALLS